MNITRFCGTSALALVIGSAMAASAANAACGDYPAGPVTIVVPFPAGSATDTVARRVAESLRADLGQNFLVENMPGADGTIAARHVAGASPDGQTLFVTTNTTHAANPAIYSELPYDPQADFEPVGGIMRISYMLAINLDNPATTFDEFVENARNASAPLTFGSGNMGGRVSGELLNARLGIEMIDVPYRGTPQGLTDLIAGRIDVFFPDPASAAGVIEQIRVLGATGPDRIGSMPDVPTISELGVEDYSVAAWVAAFAPAGTSGEIVSCLNTSLNEALQDQETIEFMGTIGAETMPTSPEGLADFVAAEIESWAELIEIADIERK